MADSDRPVDKAAETRPGDMDAQHRSPFAGALDHTPADTARDAEHIMDSPQRRETETAQAEKAAALRRRGDDALGEVTDANVRSPVPRPGPRPGHRG